MEQVIIKDEKGTHYYIKKDDGTLLHHRDDGPAIEFNNGDKVYYKYGKIHRDNDLPAKIFPDKINGGEDLFWYKEGIIHRDNVKDPAAIHSNGDRGWYREGKLYRIVYSDGGGIEWKENGGVNIWD